MRPIRRIAPAASAFAVAVTVTACTPEEPSPTQPPSESTESSAQKSATQPAGASPTPAPFANGHNPKVYVALGDSYAAMGSTHLPLDPPDSCARAKDSYPELVAAQHHIPTLANVTCQGASTLDVLATTGPNARPAQVDALTPITELVTLSIGGNDVSFGSLTRCFEQANQQTPTKAASDAGDCQRRHEDQTRAELADLPQRLDKVYAEIGRRSPNAHVVATGYIPLLNGDDDCQAIAKLPRSDRQWLAGVIAEINRTISDAAARHGATYVLPEKAAAHTGCAQQPWVDFTGESTQSFPMHPTHAGQQAMADAVARQLGLD